MYTEAFSLWGRAKLELELELEMPLIRLFSVTRIYSPYYPFATPPPPILPKDYHAWFFFSVALGVDSFYAIWHVWSNQ